MVRKCSNGNCVKIKITLSDAQPPNKIGLLVQSEDERSTAVPADTPTEPSLFVVAAPDKLVTPMQREPKENAVFGRTPDTDRAQLEMAGNSKWADLCQEKDVKGLVRPDRWAENDRLQSFWQTKSDRVQSELTTVSSARNQWDHQIALF